MEKFKYVTERELNTDLRQLYPYLATPIGLGQWFADRVEATDKKNLVIYWGDAPTYARVVAHRVNHLIRYQFGKDKEEDPSYLEFRLSYNEFTESTFLTITDYSEMTDVEELDALWSNLIDDLRRLLGDTQTK
ncbi:MAG: START-like domain-containing protein [Bernardetiaceae bacterium]